jgi:hypothetical protein
MLYKGITLINYYFNKISKAPAQLSVLHVCGEIERRRKKQILNSQPDIQPMDTLQKSQNLRNHPIIFLLKKVQLIGLPTLHARPGTTTTARISAWKT